MGDEHVLEYKKATHTDRKRYLAIVNLTARSGYVARAIDDIKEKLSHLDVTFEQTQYGGHAVQLSASSAEFDVVISIGGDGTIHEIINGLMRIEQSERPALALLPCGSGNDSCRMVGSPLAVDQAIEAITRNKQRAFDIGACNEIYFVNSFSVGIDALTTERTKKLKKETGRSGMLLYGQALLEIILKHMHPTVLDTVIEGSTERYQVLLCAVTNGQTYGAGFRINPMAKPDDGTLTLSRIDWMTRLRVLLYLPRLLRATHTTLAQYHWQEITACTITGTENELLVAQVDGELIKERTFEIEVRPQAIRFVV